MNNTKLSFALLISLFALAPLYAGCTSCRSTASEIHHEADHAKYDGSYYGSGQRIGSDLIKCYKLLIEGEHTRSKRFKDRVLKKHVSILSELKDSLSPSWLYQIGLQKTALKTDEQKQAFEDARSYYKGIAEKLQGFNIIEYLKKYSLDQKTADEILESYNFMAEGSADLAAIEDFDTAYAKWKELDKKLSDSNKKLWA
jgi:hypothetical protein